MHQMGVIAMASLLAVALVAGCGKKGAPKPPESEIKTEQKAS